jgi:type IV pilus assembly protein PilW
MNTSSAMREARSFPARTRGLTLVELMVAITISLIILAIVAQIFATSRGTYSMEEGLSRVQESGRFSMEILAYDIREAGASGCVSLQPNLVWDNIAGTSAFSIDPSTSATAYDVNGLRGYSYTGSGSNPAVNWGTDLTTTGFFTSSDVLRANSDVLVVRHAMSSVNLVNATASTSLQIDSRYSGPFSAGALVMVTDCTKADIFTIASTSTSGGVTTITPASLSRAYSANNGGELLVFKSVAYYVGDGTGFLNDGVTRVPALRRKVNGSATNEELLEGVEAIRVYYGLPADLTSAPSASSDDTAKFIPANLVPADKWAWVTSVRIGLVVGTNENVSAMSDSDTFHLFGMTATSDTFDDYQPAAADKRQRRVFTYVIKKRVPPRNPTS